MVLHALLNIPHIDRDVHIEIAPHQQFVKIQCLPRTLLLVWSQLAQYHHFGLQRGRARHQVPPSARTETS